MPTLVVRTTSLRVVTTITTVRQGDQFVVAKHVAATKSVAHSRPDLCSATAQVLAPLKQSPAHRAPYQQLSVNVGVDSVEIPTPALFGDEKVVRNDGGLAPDLTLPAPPRSPFLSSDSFQFVFSSPVIVPAEMLVPQITYIADKSVKTLASLPLLVTERILLYMKPADVNRGKLLRFALKLPFNFRFWLLHDLVFARKWMEADFFSLSYRFSFTSSYQLVNKDSWQDWQQLPSTFKTAIFIHHADSNSWTLNTDHPELWVALTSEKEGDSIYLHAFLLACKLGNHFVLRDILCDEYRVPMFYIQQGASLALKEGLLDCIQILLQYQLEFHGIDTDLLTLIDSILDIVCISDDIRTMLLLVSQFTGLSPSKHFQLSKTFTDVLTSIIPDSLRRHMISAAVHGSALVLEILINLKCIPVPSEALLQAAKHDQAEIIELLVHAGMSPSTNNDEAVRAASKCGSVHALQTLLKYPSVQPDMVDSEAIKLAALFGHIACVEALLIDARVSEDTKKQAALHLVLANALPARGSASWSSLPDLDELFVNSVSLRMLRMIPKEELPTAIEPALKDRRFVRRCIAASAALGLEAVLEVLLLSSKLNASDQDNYALLISIKYAHPTITSLLLAQPNVDPSISSQAPLLLATSMNRPMQLNLLLSCASVDPTFTESWVLRESCKNGFIHCVELLLQDGRCNASECDNQSLVDAVMNGHANVLHLLLASRQPINPNGQGGKAMKEAASRGFTDIVRLLLEHGVADPCVNDHLPLIVAATKGYTQIVQLLLSDSRVDPTARNHAALLESVRTPALVQVFAGDPRVDLSFKFDAALRTAARLGVAESVRILLRDSRVDPAGSRSAPLRLAATHNHVTVAEILLKDGRSDASACNNQALVDAVSKGYTEIVRLLLIDAKLDPAVPENRPLRTAVKKGHLEIVSLLLKDSRVSAIVGKKMVLIENGNLVMTPLNPPNKLIHPPKLTQNGDSKNASAMHESKVNKVEPEEPSFKFFTAPFTFTAVTTPSNDESMVVASFQKPGPFASLSISFGNLPGPSEAMPFGASRPSTGSGSSGGIFNPGTATLELKGSRSTSKDNRGNRSLSKDNRFKGRR
ncbi:hypothetical protein BC830DRAFT_1076816 [Chytriomyces sp. MP71]|nr:hypothetical protein BC830DRAFT_1076816 [Chytriomyces sp. MP71]